MNSAPPAAMPERDVERTTLSGLYRDQTPPRQPSAAPNQPSTNSPAWEAAPESIGPSAPTRQGRNRTSGVIVALVAAVLTVALACAGLWWFLLRDDTADLAQPAPTASVSETGEPSDSEPSTAPSPSASEDASSEPEATPVASPTPTASSSSGAEASTSETTASTGGSSGGSTPAGGRSVPTIDQAKSGLQHYLSVVTGNPSAGWELLTEERKASEKWGPYAEWWNSVRSAQLHASSCTMHGAVLRCDVDFVSTNGKVTHTKGAEFPMIVEGGVVKVSTKSASTTTATRGKTGAQDAKATLEQLRNASLGRVTGSYVAVLSSKRDGITDPLQRAANGSNTFYYEDILRLHEDLARQFAGERVLMFKSQDMDTEVPDLYYTVVDKGFTSKEQAKAWCADAYPSLNEEALKNSCGWSKFR